MNRADLFDLSHHNGTAGGEDIIDWDLFPTAPVVHKVNEGTFVDPVVSDRLPIISQRMLMFGGYTVLIVSRSTIREQIERYVDVIGPYWRPGAITQLDVEPWPNAYPRPVEVDEIVEAHDVHVELLGRPPMLYLNPRQMPGVLDKVRAQLPDIGLWEPHYGGFGQQSARRNRAVIHQWTSQYVAPGCPGGIDANTILDADALFDLAGYEDTTPGEPIMPETRFRWRHRDYADQFLIDGANVLRLSRAIVDTTDVEDGTQLVVDDDAVALRSYLHRCGLTVLDLTRV